MALRITCDFTGTMSDTFHTSPASPLTPSSTGILDTPSTPAHIQTPHLNLDVGEIAGKPFSTNFDDLLEGLGLAHPSVADAIHGGKRDVTIHDLPDIDDMMASPDWPHRGTVINFTATVRRPGALSTIHEELGESPVMTVPTACLADFEFDFDAFDAPSPNGVNGHMKKNTTVCIRRDTGVRYRMKRKRTLPRILDRNTSGSWTEQTILETLTALCVPFVSYIRWSFHSGEHNYIITDHLINGNLVDLINTNGPLASHQAIFYASELIAALSHLHSNGIVHRNVAPKSVVIDAGGHILLTDFSNADYLPHTATTAQRAVDFSKAEKSSVAYHAPELLLGWAHDAAVDCWSFGAVLYFLVFGRNPFENEDGSTTHIGIYERMLRSPISVESMRLVHPMARDLISKCLERNPSIRWNMDQIKGHAYFCANDWDQVSSMGLEAPVLNTSPLVKSPPPAVKSSVFKAPYAVTLNPTVRDSERHLPLGFNLDIYSRQDIAKESMRKDSLQDIAKVVERCKPLPRVLDIVQEDEPLSLDLSGSMGDVEGVDEHGVAGVHDIEVVPRLRSEDALTKSERISRFWDEIDREERDAAPSLNSMEFGGAAPGVPYTNAPKLRKHHSAMQTRSRLFNISTSSFHNMLRWKPRSSATLREPPPGWQNRGQDYGSQRDLPAGVHQMGSGIGFTYNVPTAVPSKLSMCSIVPPCHMFSKRFGAPFHRTGHMGILTNSSSNDKMRSGQQNARQHIEFSLPSRNPEPPVIDVHNTRMEAAAPTAMAPTRSDLAAHSLKSAGNGTFIRDMYRSPGWIVAPPEKAPSPMPLVNSKSTVSPPHHPNRRASMYVPAEPLSPATLVNGASTTNTGAPEDGEDGEDDCHINIVIPKDLEFRFDIPHQWAQRGSTLRLVPQPTGSDTFEQSYDDSVDISMCTMAARGAL